MLHFLTDKDEDNTRSLEKAIAEIPGIETLRYKPQVNNEEVGEEIVKMFEGMSLVPTLFFVDPFGYKGLSLRLVNSVLKDWGCDCLFFFNYIRISMGLSNPIFKPHMDALFSDVRANVLRKKLELNNPPRREMMIIEELCQAIKSYGGHYPLPFRFRDATGNRTSHHLIFVSKNFRGYEIMKDIMAKESSGAEQGVPSFEYSPADFLPKQSLLFQESRPLDDLQDQLLKVYAGRTLSMREIYVEHSVDTPYIASNYKEALKNLEKDGKIAARKSDGSKRKKGTFADGVLATFPDRKA